MKKLHFSETQMMVIVNQGESGVPDGRILPRVRNKQREFLQMARQIRRHDYVDWPAPLKMGGLPQVFVSVFIDYRC